MRTVAWIVGALVALGGLAWIVGALLPATATASRTRDLAAAPERVFDLVTDVGGQARWRRDVGSVEVRDDGARWTERTKTGLILEFTRETLDRPRTFVISFSSEQGISGRWVGTFEALPDGGTRVVFAETVRVDNPLFRLFSAATGQAGKAVDTYLDDLAAATATPAQGG
jgi:uncharacterized protein YndB with AHSA1/START domain